MKLLSLNVEQSKHLSLVLPFLQKEEADVVALAEVCEGDIPKLSGTSYPYSLFAPNFRFREEEGGAICGAAILSKYPLTLVEKMYCGRGSETDIPLHGMGTHAPVVLLADVNVPGDVYRVGAVHFTWTPDGQPTPEQRADVATLLARLADKGEMVLAGDFNIPRGKNELYAELAGRFTDNIPKSVTSSIDPHLHRVNVASPGELSLMVDYVWTTPEYAARDVQVTCGVSDHCGVVATISRTGMPTRGRSEP